MLDRVCPNYHYNSIFEIDLNLLREKKIKGLILDLDNTLVEQKGEKISPEVLGWLDSLLNNGFRACLVSNSLKGRAARLASKMNLPLVARAAKPRKKAFLLGQEKLSLKKEEIAAVGDQLLTDVLGGNLAGFITILVMPIGTQERIHTRLLRHVERIIIGKLVKRNLLNPKIAIEKQKHNKL